MHQLIEAREKGTSKKKIATVSVAIGLLVMASTLLLLHKEVRARWYSYRLRDERQDIVIGALKGVGELQAASAVPGVLGAIRRRFPGGTYENFSDEDVSFQRLVTDTLTRIGLKDSQGIVAIARGIESNNIASRTLVIRALQGCGSDARPALPFLVNGLSRDYETTRSIGHAIRFIAGSEEGGRLLRDALTSDSAQVRGGALILLSADLEFENHLAIPALIAALQSSDYWVQRKAVSALAHIQKQSYRVVPALVPLLRSSHPEVRLDAAFGLGCHPEAATTALPGLKNAAKDENVAVRRSAIWALGRLGPEAAVALEEILEALETGETDKLRRGAAIALRRIGARSEKVVNALRRALEDDPDEFVRRYSVEALASIGPGAVPVIPSLTAALSDTSTGVRAAAATALGQLGSKGVIPALERALRFEEQNSPDFDVSVRAPLKKAIRQLRGATEGDGN